MFAPSELAKRAEKGAVREPGPKPAEDCRTLFMGNLPYDIAELHLQTFFVDCGEIAKVLSCCGCLFVIVFVRVKKEQGGVVCACKWPGVATRLFSCILFEASYL